MARQTNGPAKPPPLALTTDVAPEEADPTAEIPLLTAVVRPPIEQLTTLLTAFCSGTC